MKKVYLFLLISLFSLSVFSQQIGERIIVGEYDETTMTIANPKPPVQVSNSAKSWNVQFNFPTDPAHSPQAGAETDGSFFYTTQWNGDSIFKYDMNGVYVGGFTISGASGLRDLAYDGTYFYGGSAGTTIYEMDFGAQTLISSISCAPAEVRHIAYDNVNNGFWVGNWSTDMNLVSRTGSIINTIPSATHGCASTYGSAFDNESIGGPYLWVISANSGDGVAELKQIDIATGMQTGIMTDALVDLGLSSGLGGGLFIQSNIVPGTTTIGGLIQNTTIFGYDLSTVVDSFDVAVVGFVSPITGVGLTNTETISVEIKNYGTETISGFPISYEINGATAVTETFTGSLTYGETASFSFAQTADLSVVGEYSITVTTALAYDADLDNNSGYQTAFNLSNTSQRLVLIEHFTQASCGPCASQNPALDALITNAQNIDKVTHIAYHTSWPGTDPMYDFNDNNGLGNARVDYYDVSGVPNCVISGNIDQGLPSVVTQDKIDAEYMRFGFLNITGTADFIDSELQIDLSFEAYTNFDNGTIIAHAVLVEDVEYTSAPGTNGEISFPDVMRNMFPGEFGTNLNNPSDGDIVPLSFTYQIPSQIDIANCKLIVFVQNDDNKDIFMATQFEIEDLCSMSLATEATNITEIGVFGSATVTVTGGTPPFTYQWDDSNNQTTETATDLQEGTYTVIVTDSLGCVQIASVDISDLSAISDFENSGINIYPNPTNGLLNIENIRNSEIYIYNILGEKVAYHSVKNDNTTIDLSNLSNGTYLIKLITKEGTYSKQIFLNK